MFKRIKNLLNISKYTVDQLRSIKYVQSNTNGYIEVAPPPPMPEVTMTTSSSSRMATIINMQAEDPFKQFDDETSQQSPNDSTSRN